MALPVHLQWRRRRDCSSRRSCSIWHLSSHHQKSLTDLYGKKIASEVWNCFTAHYTPKHGSWLNQAEIEIGMFAGQCLGKRRIPDLKTLRREARAWNRQMNRNRVKINGSFDPIKNISQKNISAYVVALDNGTNHKYFGGRSQFEPGKTIDLVFAVQSASTTPTVFVDFVRLADGSAWGSTVTDGGRDVAASFEK